MGLILVLDKKVCLIVIPFRLLQLHPVSILDVASIRICKCIIFAAILLASETNNLAIYTFIPNASDAAPSIIAFIPDAHTLLIVVHGVDIGRPAPRAAWRAGACPKPA